MSKNVMAKIFAGLVAIALLIGTIIYDATVEPERISVQSIQLAEMQEFEPVPAFSFETLDGEKMSIGDLQHDTILIHFWAGWCTVCFAEFPPLLDHVEKESGNVALLAIATDDDFDLPEKFMKRLEKQQGVNLNADNVYWIWDQSKDISLHTFNTIRVPETIVVNADRMMTDKYVGPGPWEVEEFVHP